MAVQRSKMEGVATIELGVFEEVAEVLRGLVPRALGEVRCRPRRYGIKVWFGPVQPTREHYEAQLMSPHAVDDAKVLALEVGFHTEHPDVATNDKVIAGLMTAEKKWRRGLGAEAVVGPFLGKADVWRRISETWPDPNLDDPEMAFEIGARLTDYISALEPLRRKTA
jgi:hypothetical protein